jgi:hypothetical protein
MAQTTILREKRSTCTARERERVFIRRNRGDVRHPSLIRAIYREISIEHILCHRMRWITGRRPIVAFPTENHSQSKFLHQTSHTTDTNLDATDLHIGMNAHRADRDG